MAEKQTPQFADGTDPDLGYRVQRVWKQDGTRRAGKRYGPILWITKLADYTAENGTVYPRAMATLKVVKDKKPAGTSLVWHLKRAPGRQPQRGEPDTRSLPRNRVKGNGDASTMKGVVSSIRITNDLRERLGERGEEISTIMRRDLIRLYDLLDVARERLSFPAGTLGTLALAWQRAAPPPPHDTLRPQWFVPVLLDALVHLGTPEASTLALYLRALNELQAYAVQDVVERWSPESVGADKLRRLGLKECPQNGIASPEPRPAAKNDRGHVSHAP